MSKIKSYFEDLYGECWTDMIDDGDYLDAEFNYGE